MLLWKVDFWQLCRSYFFYPARRVGILVFIRHAGNTLPSRVNKPPCEVKHKNLFFFLFPRVLFCTGENIHRGWSTYYRSMCALDRQPSLTPRAMTFLSQVRQIASSQGKNTHPNWGGIMEQQFPQKKKVCRQVRSIGRLIYCDLMWGACHDFCTAPHTLLALNWPSVAEMGHTQNCVDKCDQVRKSPM